MQAEITISRTRATTPRAAREAVRFDAVGKRYGGRVALADISFTLAEGESVAITGVNGAGKTTLLRCLLDFAYPDSGVISIFGVRSRDPRARSRLAFVPERFQPPAQLTGHEVLQWLSGLQGRSWTRAHSGEVFERFAIAGEALDRPVRLFSKGMAQKLALAAALAADKPLLVLDEPMSGLDPLARESVAAMLQQARERGATLLFTSHSLADVARLCDRLVIVHDGALRFVGTPAALIEAQQAEDLDRAFLSRIQSRPHGHAPSTRASGDGCQ